MRVIETERLILEKLSTLHISDDYVSWMNDPQVFRYLESGGKYSKEDLTQYLKGVEQKKELLFWAIILKKENKHIGNIKIDPINIRHGLGEYGILMGDRNSWGKGYAKEASIEVVNYCFNEIGLRKINLGVVSDNIGAVKLYEKIGFVIEGHLKAHGFYDGKLCDSYRMAIFNPNMK